MDLIMSILTLILYLLPTLIGAYRNHTNYIPIVIVNIFTGFTIIGWIVALTWSLTDNVGKE